ncbi:hypothetical protein Bsel_1990 [[Bacillus] selenitireducens MLS10]|uniref:Uncharacterized protein n=1 Tax=Bacillus selenitireducens (strain ATCC 700615 / DSM 15326 / MLS10) TaxID=439292 RepID=D6XUK8_BACIE|nr:hypothetical protein Bsel_1990 [[Bacillus] selenitireducens MLS10]
MKTYKLLHINIPIILICIMLLVQLIFFYFHKQSLLYKYF